MTKRDLPETWFRRVWAEEDLDAIAEMMATGTPVHGLTKVPHHGPAEFRAFAEMLLKLIGDVRISIEKFTEDGDWVTVLMLVTARSRATREEIAFDGLALVKVEGDKLAMGYNYIDFIGLFEQLGLMQGDTLATCLCGKPAA